jgi:hypothetical protein
MRKSMYAKFLTIAVIIMLSLIYISLYISTINAQGELFTVMSVTWGTPTSPTCVGPGMQTRMLTIVLRYNGDEAFLGLKARLILPQLFSDSLSKKSGIAETTYMQQIAKGQTITLIFWIDIDGEATAGDYTAYLVLFKYSNGNWVGVEMKIIGITLSRIEKISIESSITSIYPGYTNVSIKLKNQGNGYAHGVLLEVSSQSPQVLVINSSIWIGDLSPFSSRDVNIPLYISPTLIDSTVPLYLKISYIDECGFSKVFTSTTYLSIKQPKPPQVILRISPTTIVAGMKNNVTIIIINNGSTTIKEISISLDFPQQILLVNGTSKLFIDELKPYSSVNFSLILTSLGITSDKVVTQISATLSYRDQYDIARNDKIVTAFIIVKPQTLIGIDIEPKSIVPGRVNKLTLFIRNAGNVPVYGLDLSITPLQSLAIKDFDGRWYIGDLKPGEVRTRELNVIVPSTISNPIQITVALSYIDAAFTLRTETRYLSLITVISQRSLVVQVSPQELSIGENSLEITVFNNYSEKIYDVVATVSSSQLVFKGFDGKWYIGDLEHGESKSLKLRVFVPSTTVTAIQISISLQYRDVAGTIISESRVFGLTIKPSITLLTTLIEPKQINVGKNNITIRVRNCGNTTVHNLQATVNVQGATFIEFNGKWYIGNLKPSDEDSIRLSLMVPSTASSIQISVVYSYVDEGGGSRSESHTITIEVKQPVINIVVWAEPQTIPIGDNNITIHIKNKGNSTAYNTIVTFSVPQQMLLLNSDGKVNIGDIKPNETKSIPLHVVVTSGTTIMQMPMTISYTDEGGASRSESRVLSFRITTQPVVPNFKISIEPSSIVSGVQSKLRLIIINTANRTLNSVVASISSQAIAFIGFDGKWYIGSLEPSETRSIDLLTYVNPVQTSQSITISVVLTYIDTLTGGSSSETYLLTIITLPNTLKQPPEISIYPQILVAGIVNNLVISIGNTNTFNISSVTISITPPAQSSLLTSETYFIPSLKPGAKADIAVPLYIPPTLGSSTLSLTITISYFDGATTSSLTKSIAFLVALPPILKVTNYAVLPQTISPGQTFSLTFTIANSGIGTAYNVTVVALPNPLYTPLLGSQTFIGDLAKGASTTITFSFRASQQLNMTMPSPSINMTVTRTPSNRTFTTRFPIANRSIPYPRNITIPYTQGGMRYPYIGFQPYVVILITYMDNVGRKYNSTLQIPLTIALSSTTTTITTHNIGSTFSNRTLLLLVIVVVALGVLLTYSVIRVRKR